MSDPKNAHSENLGAKIAKNAGHLPVLSKIQQICISDVGTGSNRTDWAILSGKQDRTIEAEIIMAKNMTTPPAKNAWTWDSIVGDSL